MSAGRIEANKVIFQKLFSQDFWFVIPEYQRSYVWQTDNIIELVEDLYYAFENKDDSDYFLGSLVLKKIEGSSFPEYEVLDGQQRLTTFFIMMAVMRDLISDDNSKNTIHKKIYQEENKSEILNTKTTELISKLTEQEKLLVKKYNGTVFLDDIKEARSNSFLASGKRLFNPDPIVGLTEFNGYKKQETEFENNLDNAIEDLIKLAKEAAIMSIEEVVL